MEIINKNFKHKLTYVCSPLSMGDYEENIKNAERYCRLFTNKGFNPIAPHIYYTRFLDDTIIGERQTGIKLGLQLLSLCDSLFVVINSGISKGMLKEIELFNESPIQKEMYFIYFTDLDTLEYDYQIISTNNKSVTEVIKSINLVSNLKCYGITT